MRASFFLLILASLFLLSCGDDNAGEQKPTKVATALLYRLNSSGAAAEQIGEATFWKEDGVIRLEVAVEGLPPGSSHALHLHEGNCEQPGMHWNGGTEDRYCTITDRGQAWGRPFLGDIGNIEIGADGKGVLEISTQLWSVGDGSPVDVAGTALMLHEHAEDFALECDPTHQNHPHNNPKIACGNVALVSQ